MRQEVPPRKPQGNQGAGQTRDVRPTVVTNKPEPQATQQGVALDMGEDALDDEFEKY